MPVGIEIGEGIAAREDQVAEGEAVEKKQRQNDEDERNRGAQQAIQGALLTGGEGEARFRFRAALLPSLQG